jgi:uncharacterized protein (DUF433 family)
MVPVLLADGGAKEARWALHRRRPGIISAVSQLIGWRERNMGAKTVRIVDIGRGPQIEGSRLTVLDVFYYLHRGHDFDFIHRAMPSLSREQFGAVADYLAEHRDELAEEDRYVEERIRQGIAEQKAKGLYHEIDTSVPVEQRAARLKEKLRRKLAEEAERNGGQPAR